MKNKKDLWVITGCLYIAGSIVSILNGLVVKSPYWYLSIFSLLIVWLGYLLTKKKMSAFKVARILAIIMLLGATRSVIRFPVSIMQSNPFYLISWVLVIASSISTLVLWHQLRQNNKK